MKCLHVHYAHYLACGMRGGVAGNLVGEWTHAAMQEECAHITAPPKHHAYARNRSRHQLTRRKAKQQQQPQHQQEEVEEEEIQQGRLEDGDGDIGNS